VDGCDLFVSIETRVSRQSVVTHSQCVVVPVDPWVVG
jgi:hypothetical protein